MGALLFVISGITVACGGGNADATPMELIAGEDSKSWRLKKERNENGIRQKTTDVEKQEMFVFDTANSFTTNTLTETRAGSWKYEGTEFTMQFYDNAEQRTFVMEELSDTKMRWRAADGTEYVLTTK